MVAETGKQSTTDIADDLRELVGKVREASSEFPVTLENVPNNFTWNKDVREVWRMSADRAETRLRNIEILLTRVVLMLADAIDEVEAAEKADAASDEND